MGVLTTCCLNLAPPPHSNSAPISSQSSKAQELKCPAKERSWKNQCVLGLTCAIVALEAGNLAFIGGNQDAAIAGDMESAVASNANRLQRWSDKRACRPWQSNSLETIVPENLPRPSTRRRWEAIEFPPEAPPPFIVLPKFGANSCFTL